MHCLPDERFPKSARLRKRAEYLRVQESGHKVQSRSFVGLFTLRQQGGTRLGITTSKRVGCAAVRNRTRRLVREAFRRGLLAVPEGIDLVVIAKRTAAGAPAAVLFEELRQLGHRVRRTAGRAG